MKILFEWIFYWIHTFLIKIWYWNNFFYQKPALKKNIQRICNKRLKNFLTCSIYHRRENIIVNSAKFVVKILNLLNAIPIASRKKFFHSVPLFIWYLPVNGLPFECRWIKCQWFFICFDHFIEKNRVTEMLSTFTSQRLQVELRLRNILSVIKLTFAFQKFALKK